MNTVAECTVPEKILLAAYELEDQGQSPFSAETLIVASWQKFPKTFGLKGYADQYPDSNKVLTSIMGVKGLAGRGWLAKEGQKLYSLSRDGKQVVRRLLHDGDSPPPEVSSKLSRDLEKLLMSLFDSSASQKYLEGLKQELTFADACRFWGISESLHGEALDARLNRMRAGLSDIDRSIGATGIDLSNGRSVTASDVAQLHKVDDYLKERFGRHLTLLRNRGGRG